MEQQYCYPYLPNVFLRPHSPVATTGVMGWLQCGWAYFFILHCALQIKAEVTGKEHYLLREGSLASMERKCAKHDGASAAGYFHAAREPRASWTSSMPRLQPA